MDTDLEDSLTNGTVNTDSNDLETVTSESDEYNSEDNVNLNSLSDKEIFLDFISISSLCSSWKSQINSLNLTSERVSSSALKYFSDNGILENYIVCLSTAVNSLIMSVNNIINSIETSSDSQFATDSSYSKYSGTKSSNYSTNSAGSSYNGANTDVNNNELDLSINTDSLVENLTSKDSILMSILISNILKDGDLNSLLDDENKLSELKKVILDSVNINDELKEVISEMDIEVFKKFLKSMADKGSLNTVSDDSISFLHNYLVKISSINNISYDSLINDPSNESLLYNNVNYFNDAVNYLDSISNDNVETIKENLFDIYDGNAISDVNQNRVDAVRNIIDVLSENNNVSYENLISENIKNSLLSVTSAKDFFGLFSKFDSENIQSILKLVL